jgi:hypothetical protein
VAGCSGFDRAGQREGCGRLAEWVAKIIGGTPSLGGYFDQVTRSVRKIQDDLGRQERVPLEANPDVDFPRPEFAVAGARFQGSERRLVSLGRRRRFVLGVEIRGYPITESRGAKREHLPGIEIGGDAGAILAIFRAEGSGGAGVIEQGVRLIANGKAGWHSGSSVACASRKECRSSWEMVEGTSEISRVEARLTESATRREG